jgi:hypothetical protein
MIGKYNKMNSTNPINPGVVIPALYRSVKLVYWLIVGVTYLSGSVLRICKKLGLSEFRIITKACPPKYI